MATTNYYTIVDVVDKGQITLAILIEGRGGVEVEHMTGLNYVLAQRRVATEG